MMEEQNKTFLQLPPLSSKFPWFVAQNVGADEEDQYFFYLPDLQQTQYHSRIPELFRRRIWGYYHGWVILSDHIHNVSWSLWNPVTSQRIPLPRLILKDGDTESIRECCLSAPPNDPASVFLLTRYRKATFVFLRLDCKRKKWIEMSYANHLKRLTGEDDGDLLHSLTWCNGKIYALNSNYKFSCFIIQLDMEFKEKEVLIRLSLSGLFPGPSWMESHHVTKFLKGYSSELFCISVVSLDAKVDQVNIFKFDMTGMSSEDMDRFKGLEDMSGKRWEEEDTESLRRIIAKEREVRSEVRDLKDVFFVDLGRGNMAYHRHGTASELGGYIHIRDKMENILYSYHVKGETLSIANMPSLVLPTSNMSLWECRLADHHEGTNFALDSKQGGKGIGVRSVTQNELNGWNLLNFPLHLLEIIMEHSLGVEYMNFRATCKRCVEAAPLIQWSNKTSSMRLHNYSVVSPWFMVVDYNQKIITFTDPILGDSYFMQNRRISMLDRKFLCSMSGWLLFFFKSDSERFGCFVIHNPFTCDLRQLPVTGCSLNAACLSASPMSHDCMVFGFPKTDKSLILIHHVAGEKSWRRIRVDTELNVVNFPTLFGEDLYALDRHGKLISFKKLGSEDICSAIIEAATVPICDSRTKNYLTKYGQDLLLKVSVGKFGERVEVFKWIVSEEYWEKIYDLGNLVIYLCDTTCLCIEAYKVEMKNKIYFPLLHSKNKKIVCYSLATCTFNALDGEDSWKDFFGTTLQMFPHAWIEPAWA